MRVRVRADWPERGPARVHIRTPAYLRGRTGVIERPMGSFPNPEALAFGRDGLPALRLYQVRFDAGVFGASAPGDSLVADLFESWLVPAP
jgi:nitrile hydratase